MKHLPFSAALLALGLAACTANRNDPTKFLTSTAADTSERLPRLPFEHSWRAPAMEITHYRNIMVRPVTTDFLHPGKVTNSQGKDLAKRFTAALRLAFSSPVCGYYITEDSSLPKTLILEVALTDATGMGTEQQELAFEARVKDAVTGRTVATAADRRNVEEFDEWADELMQATNKELFPKVRKNSPSPF